MMSHHFRLSSVPEKAEHGNEKSKNAWNTETDISDIPDHYCGRQRKAERYRLSQPFTSLAEQVQVNQTHLRCVAPGAPFLRPRAEVECMAKPTLIVL